MISDKNLEIRALLLVFTAHFSLNLIIKFYYAETALNVLLRLESKQSEFTIQIKRIAQKIQEKYQQLFEYLIFCKAYPIFHI